jgi:hypothetical protein
MASTGLGDRWSIQLGGCRRGEEQHEQEDIQDFHRLHFNKLGLLINRGEN